MAEVIVALDLPRGAEALALLDRLPEARWVKVGSILMTREGPPLVRALVDRGLRVFLDLKWHDIPNTVAEAVAAARDARGLDGHGPHPRRRGDDGGGGPRRGRSAWPWSASPSSPRTTAAAYAEAVGRADVELGAEVERLARSAVAAGLRGRGLLAARGGAGARQVAARGALVVVPGDPAGRRTPRATRSGSPTRGEAAAGRAPPTWSSGARSSRRPTRRRRCASFMEEAQCVVLLTAAPARPGSRPRPTAQEPELDRGGGAGPAGLVRPRCRGPGGRQPPAPGSAARGRPVRRAGAGAGGGAARRTFMVHGAGGGDGGPGGAGGRSRAGAMSSCSGGTGWPAPRRSGPQSLLLGYRLGPGAGGGWSELRVVGLRDRRGRTCTVPALHDFRGLRIYWTASP